MTKNPTFWKVNRSVSFDRMLFRQDIRGSLAHVRMLGRRKILPAADVRKIEKGLHAIERELEAGRFRFKPTDEDIHMAIERRLIEKIGPVGGKLHTGRSRNDQVATDLRLYVMDACGEIDRRLVRLLRALAKRAEKTADWLAPAYTHLQRAQPTTLGHLLLAHAERFARDRERFADVLYRTGICPLGSAAGTGTPHPIDRKMTADALGFREPSRNSLDGVSDRDFLIDFHAASAACAIHLSGFGEDGILAMSSEFGFLSLPPEICSGSSIMPNKRNPDALELMRGKAGRVLGNLQALLVTLKGLPLAYNKDLQEDKEGLFDSVETIVDLLDLAEKVVGGARWDRKRLEGIVREAAGNMLATELADFLVREGIPFRKAHAEVQRILDRLDGRSLADLPPADLPHLSPHLTPAAVRTLDPERAVRSRKGIGMTAPAKVRREARRILKCILKT